MENRVSLSHSHCENSSSGDSNREPSSKRRKILEQKKVNDQLIDVACTQKDHLSPFPSFRHFNCSGLSLYLQSGQGDKLSYSVKKYIQNLLKINMEGPYGSQWSTEEKVKLREMVSTQAHYIFVHEASNANANGMFPKSDAEKTTSALKQKDPMVAFVHFRFIIEEMIPVLYVYELQIEPRFQGRGLGTFLMELIELIACKNCMGAVVFTVQKANSKALNFYQSKLRYTVSSISPSRINLLMAMETSYEILCKAFNEEAKVVLEANDVGAIYYSKKSKSSHGETPPIFQEPTNILQNKDVQMKQQMKNNAWGVKRAFRLPLALLLTASSLFI